MNYKIKDGDRFGYFKIGDRGFILMLKSRYNFSEYGWVYPEVEDAFEHLSKLKYQAFDSKLIRTLFL